MLSWTHSGFSIHNAIRVEPEDTAGLERLGRYLVHPPIVQERLDYHGPSAPSTYRGRRPHPLRGEDSPRRAVGQGRSRSRRSRHLRGTEGGGEVRLAP